MKKKQQQPAPTNGAAPAATVPIHSIYVWKDQNGNAHFEHKGDALGPNIMEALLLVHYARLQIELVMNRILASTQNQTTQAVEPAGSAGAREAAR